MPDWPLSDDQVRSVVAYVDQVASAGPATTAAAGAAPAPVQGDPELGRNLFQGTMRLTNGGPAVTTSPTRT